MPPKMKGMVIRLNSPSSEIHPEEIVQFGTFQWGIIMFGFLKKTYASGFPGFIGVLARLCSPCFMLLLCFLYVKGDLLQFHRS